MSRLQAITGLALIALATIALPARGRAGAQTTPAFELPAIPDPVPVELDAAATAFLALDLTNALCRPIPACMATLPAAQSGLAAARAAGALVVYSTGSLAVLPDDTIIADVAPAPDDPIVHGRPDKFFNTNLGEILQQAGIKTVVVIGEYANGAVMYTSMELNIRGYTVVVAQDAISSPADFDTYLARYQLLHEPTVSNNAQNVPLKPNSVTLSRTDLISYR